MKLLKLFAVLLMIGIVTSNNSANAQTIRKQISISFDGVEAWCLNRTLSGTWTLNLTYHLDKKTSKIDRLHFNFPHPIVWDTETGEKVIMMDTGNDNLGAYWDFFNNINSYTNNLYPSVEDGWLDDVMPTELPEEGTMVEMAWKYIIGGEKFYLSTLMQIHKNAKGEVKVDFTKTWANCNE